MSTADPSHPLIEGWLSKQGHKFKNWNKRWFVLEPHQLLYYSDILKTDLKGSFEITSTSFLARLPDMGGRRNLLRLHSQGSGGSQLLMSATSAAEMHAWETSINKAIDMRKAEDEANNVKVEPVVTVSMKLKSATPVVSVFNASTAIAAGVVKNLSLQDKDMTIKVHGASDAVEKQLRGSPKVELVPATTEYSDIVKSLATTDYVFIASYGSDDCLAEALPIIEASKEADVGFLSVLSSTAALSADTDFAIAHVEHEKLVSERGIPYCIIRLPMLLDDITRHFHSMTTIRQYFGPIAPFVRCNPAAISDISEAIAIVLCTPDDYADSALNLFGEPLSEFQISTAFSSAFLRPIEYVQVSYETARETLIDGGMTPHMADGLLGFYKLAEEESPVQTSGPADLELILARPVISIVNFAERYKIDPSSYIYRPPKSAPVLALVGASGSIGVSTLTALSSRVKTNTILAGVRDMLHTKTHALSHLPHVELFQADMNHPDNLKNIMMAADRVFIIAPGTMDRAELAINAINACKKAGTSFMVVLSVLTVERSGTIFGEQFKKVESAAAASGVPHCIIRLPFFLDNVMGQLSLMMNTGKFYGPISPSKKHNSVAVSDVGEAVAKIMLDPKPYTGRILNLCGVPVSEAEVAAAFSDSLGKNVEYVQVPFDATKSTLLGFGMPEGMAEGIIELYRMIEAEDGLMSSESGDLEAVLGRPPISIKEICATVEFSEPPTSVADAPVGPSNIDHEFCSGSEF
jgi:uncharacterized protein YbjT (DUF2867 family)